MARYLFEWEKQKMLNENYLMMINKLTFQFLFFFLSKDNKRPYKESFSQLWSINSIDFFVIAWAWAIMSRLCSCNMYKKRVCLMIELMLIFISFVLSKSNLVSARELDILIQLHRMNQLIRMLSSSCANTLLTYC